MPRFEFVESNTWLITADSESDAMSLWREYRYGGDVTDEFDSIDGYGEFLGEVDEL